MGVSTRSVEPRSQEAPEPSRAAAPAPSRWRTLSAARLGWSWADAAVVAGTAVLAAGVFWAMHRALVDDAYITLDYARTLAEHGQWGMIPGHPANTATSPLNVLLLGLLTLLLTGPVKALGVLFVANAALLAVGLLGLGRSTGLGRRYAVIAAPLLLLDPLLASSTGLETMLAVTAVVLLLWTSAGDRAWPVGVVAGITVLIRLDLAVVVVVTLLLRRSRWRRLPWVLVWTAAVALPWYLFSWRFLGSALPDTVLIKTAATWGHFATGLVTTYAGAYPLAVVGTLAPAAVGAVAALGWPAWRGWIPGPDRSFVPIAGVAAVAYYFTFLLLGTSPFFWYYGVPIALLVLATSALTAALTRRGRLLTRVATAGLALAVALAPAALVWGRQLTRQHPLQVALVKGNWAEPWQYARIGRDLPRVVGRGTAVQSPGEVGTILYFCHCPLVDKFSDRGLLAGQIREKRRSGLLWRLNYQWLDPQALRPQRAPYRLKWEPGLDPSSRGWNVYSRTGHRAISFQGHISLLRADGRPVRGDRALR